MERARPWHPFRVPGLCGLRGTTFILTLISILICLMILWMTEELKGTKTTNTNETETTVQNDTTIQRPKRATSSRITLVYGAEKDTAVVEEGDSVSFECNPYWKNCPGCGWGEDAATFSEVYFCRHPCKWADVKAYTNPTTYGQDSRFRVIKKDIYGNNRGGMVVGLRNAKMTDTGDYYCGIDVSGNDWYQAISLRVRKQEQQQTEQRTTVTPRTSTERGEDMGWTDNGGLGRETRPEVQNAMMKCQGNKACTLALMQREELGINTSCWLCLKMSNAWTSVPLTVEMIKETECAIPQQMTDILKVASDIKQGKIPTKHPAVVCERLERDKHTDMLISPLRVTHAQGDVCVCSKRQGQTVRTGWSDCKVRIEMNDELTNNCTAVISGITVNFTCPFNKPKDTTPAKGWEGCCYPALVNVGTSVYLPNSVKPRSKRDVTTAIGTLPDTYNGYVLSNPWTTPGANVGWSLLLGVGTAVSINKINGLAWMILAIANSTEHALEMVNDEMRQIRDAVIQNRLVLDMLTAEKGGVCKMLGLSCCFHIPDYNENITNVVSHMRMAVRAPEKVERSWFGWLTDLRGWISWVGFTVLPIVGFILLILICLPCIMPCITGIVQGVVTSMATPQLASVAVHDVHDDYDNYDFDDEFGDWMGDFERTTEI